MVMIEQLCSWSTNNLSFHALANNKMWKITSRYQLGTNIHSIRTLGTWYWPCTLDRQLQPITPQWAWSLHHFMRSVVVRWAKFDVSDIQPAKPQIISKWNKIKAYMSWSCAHRPRHITTWTLSLEYLHLQVCIFCCSVNALAKIACHTNLLLW